MEIDETMRKTIDLGRMESANSSLEILRFRRREDAGTFLKEKREWKAWRPESSRSTEYDEDENEDAHYDFDEDWVAYWKNWVVEKSSRFARKVAT